MQPGDLFKRRHYGTPQSILLIIANYTVFAVAASLFASCNKINWFFWVVIALLALYNFFNIRKDREEYTRIRVIAYVISVMLMAGLFILFRSGPQNC